MFQTILLVMFIVQYVEKMVKIEKENIKRGVEMSLRETIWHFLGSILTPTNVCKIPIGEICWCCLPKGHKGKHICICGKELS
jgi:hypothetical protein